MTQIEIFCYIPEVLGHFALQSVFSPVLISVILSSISWNVSTVVSIVLLSLSSEFF